MPPGSGRFPTPGWPYQCIQTPLFREARYLLAEETGIRHPSLHHSVLAAVAVAEGNNTSGGIASDIGRKSNEVAHPLRVLEDCRLLIREPDLFRPGRARAAFCSDLSRLRDCG